MKKLRKFIVIFLAVALIASSIPAGVLIFQSLANTKDGKKNPSDLLIKNSINLDKNVDIIKPLKTLISALYYDKGTYEDYKSVVLNQDKALSKDSFESIRKDSTAKDYFKYDPETIEKLFKHMIAIKQGDKFIVYYLKDITSSEELKNARSWTITKKSKNWLVNN